MSMMITDQKAQRKEMYTQLFGVLTDETRRRIIRILRGQTGSISEQDLAERLAAMESDSKPEETTSETAEAVLIQLYHIHLPKLVDTGLVEWDRDARTVATTDYPMDEIDQLEEIISTNGWGSIASALADSHRREALKIVESENEPTRCGDLAHELVSLKASGQQAETLIENVTVQLHNHHLPKLEEAGLVEYNIDDATVAYRGPPTLTSVLPEA